MDCSGANTESTMINFRECEYAAKMLDLMFMGDINYSMGPKGCSYISRLKHVKSSVRFNVHETGRSNGKYSPICRRKHGTVINS